MAIPMEYLNINCLVVDDEASMRKTVSNMLTRMGFKSIITAADGKEALAIIQTSKIDLVICDINMPEMTGLELFKTVRENRRYSDIIFIFVTAEVRKHTVARAAEEGGAGYIIKPFVMATLEDKIAGVLSKKFKPSSVETHLKNFQQYLEGRDLPSAENELKRALEMAPESPTIIYNFGQLYLAKGETDKAIESFKDAIAKKPLFVKAYDAIGEIYEDMGDVQSAIKYYEAAHNISSSNTDRLITLSKLYKKTGEIDRAEKILKDAVSDVRQDVSTSGHLMGEMYLAKNENDKALEVLVKAYKKNPSDTSIMQSLAEAYRKVGQPEQAIEIYKEILKINPNNAHAYYSMGKTFLEMGIKDKAINAIKKAWEINPFSKEITADLKALAEKDKFDI
jgi:two-component system chemotaxis response regulator CheY